MVGSAAEQLLLGGGAGDAVEAGEGGSEEPPSPVADQDHRAGSRGSEPAPAPAPERPCWHGEAWAHADGTVLGLPIFDVCCMEFKRLMLRELRIFEYQVRGLETWYDTEREEICTLDGLPEDQLPPHRDEFVGQTLDPGEKLCCGGDYDSKLIVVLSGSLDKLVGETCFEGLAVVRRLSRGECEGITEFVGAGSQQRCALFRAGERGCRVRLIPSEIVAKLCQLLEAPPPEEENPIPIEFDVEYVKEWQQALEEKAEELAAFDLQLEDYEVTDKNHRPVQLFGGKKLGQRHFPLHFIKKDFEEPEPPGLLFKEEACYFAEMKLDKIGALPHSEGTRLLGWIPGVKNSAAGYPGLGEPFDFMSIPKQRVFQMSNALGLSVSGPLPEGLEERYFLDGQIVSRKSVPGDCAVLVLRGEAVAEIPAGCESCCVPAIKRPPHPDPAYYSEGWLGDCAREPPPPPVSIEEEYMATKTVSSSLPYLDTVDKIVLQDAGLFNVMPQSRRAKKKGEYYMHEARVIKAAAMGWPHPDHVPTPPPEPEPPGPRAIFKPGDVFGQLALLGVPVPLCGTIRARGPVLVAVLHRHVLFIALLGQPERPLFEPEGVWREEQVRILSAPKHQAAEGSHRAKNLGPATGPPVHSISAVAGPAAGTIGAFRSEGPYAGRAGCDALDLVLLGALRQCALLWKIIESQPARLLEAMVAAFEPRLLLPGEAVVTDEDGVPSIDSQMLFVCIHGTLVVNVVGADIEWVGQGAVLGEAQLLALTPWTRTITVDPNHRGECLIQVLRRETLLEVISGHPYPKERLREVEEELKDARQADWKILQGIPAFKAVAKRPFLSRLFIDGDICFYCPGDHVSIAGESASSLAIVLAGKLRSEQPQTLFCVELRRGNWAYQNNVLGNEPYRSNDVVSIAHSMVLYIHRHVLLNAMFDFPEARHGIMANETWRQETLRISSHRLFSNMPRPVVSSLEGAAAPKYFRPSCQLLGPGEIVEQQALLFILRGDVTVTILGEVVRRLGPGDTLGLLGFLGLPQVAGPCELVATTAVDVLSVPRAPMLEALADERYEDDLKPFTTMTETLNGEELKDAFGFSLTGGGRKFITDCVERSEIFKVCSDAFVAQIPSLCEDIPFFPGDKLFSQGEGIVACPKIFFIQAGRVKCEALGMDEPEIVEAGGTLGDMVVLGIINEQSCTATAETHVWARVLDKSLLDRALASFPGEEKRLNGKGGGGGAGIFDD